MCFLRWMRLYCTAHMDPLRPFPFFTNFKWLKFVSLLYFSTCYGELSLIHGSHNTTHRLKPAGYEEFLPVFNSSREARRSVVSGGLFSIVAFDNVPCMADSGEVGTCYSSRECSNLQGTESGICAGNYGVCCVVAVTCGGTVTTNNTYFVNQGYPNGVSGPSSCSITVNKLSGATQLYLEFDEFQISDPILGTCSNDSFVISVNSLTMHPLCGVLSGQMYYLDISGTSGPFTLTVKLVGNIAGMNLRKWKIRIVQFRLRDFCSAPPGCNMYFRDQSGVVESFNYNGGNGQFINNHCYTICFALPPGYCSVLLTENEFMLSGTAPNDCTEGDYLLANGQQFCGDSLANGMLVVNQTMPGYISIQICSGSSNPDMDVGFNLNYDLVPCTAAG